MRILCHLLAGSLIAALSTQGHATTPFERAEDLFEAADSNLHQKKQHTSARCFNSVQDDAMPSNKILRIGLTYNDPVLGQTINVHYGSYEWLLVADDQGDFTWTKKDSAGTHSLTIRFHDKSLHWVTRLEFVKNDGAEVVTYCYLKAV